MLFLCSIPITRNLISLLDDQAANVRSITATSLAMIARQSTSAVDQLIAALEADNVAIRAPVL